MTDKQKLREEIIETTKKVRATGLFYGKEGFDYLLEVLEEYTDYNDGYDAGVKNGAEIGYNQGLNDAWELHKKLWYMGTHKLKEMFGYEFVIDVIENCTLQEVVEKLKAYEEAQEIKVGDVIKTSFGNAVITQIKDNDYVFITSSGAYGRCNNPVAKTGKHIDIDSLLKQIGE